MKKLLLSTSLVLGATFLFSGCATIVQGSKQSVSFSSSPKGATVLLNGQEKCQTPCTITLKKNKFDSVSFSKEGYMTHTQEIKKQTDPWFFGNILIGGLLGSTTDIVSGSAYEYSPNKYFVEMKEENWSFNNKTLDKDKSSDLRAFILTSFRDIKNAKKAKETLYLLVQKRKKIDYFMFSNIVDNSNNPIELLNKFKED